MHYLHITVHASVVVEKAVGNIKDVNWLEFVEFLHEQEPQEINYKYAGSTSMQDILHILGTLAFDHACFALHKVSYGGGYLNSTLNQVKK